MKQTTCSGRVCVCCKIFRHDHSRTFTPYPIPEQFPHPNHLLPLHFQTHNQLSLFFLFSPTLSLSPPSLRFPLTSRYRSAPYTLFSNTPFSCYASHCCSLQETHHITKMGKPAIQKISTSKSLFLFTTQNCFRRTLINYFVLREWFDYFILLTILANCAFLAMTETFEEAE